MEEKKKTRRIRWWESRKDIGPLTAKRVEWIKRHAPELKQVRKFYSCPPNCMARYLPNAKCLLSSSPGWDYWVWAFTLANVPCDPRKCKGGSAAINKSMAEYILANAPAELLKKGY